MNSVTLEELLSILGLTHCTKWTYCESTYLGRFSLLQIPLLGLRSGREEQKIKLKVLRTIPATLAFLSMRKSYI